MTDALLLKDIGQIAIPVRDLTRAITFYREALGLAFLFQAPPGLAFFDCAGLRLMLDTAGNFQGHSSIVYFRVADIRDAHRRLGDRGVVFQDAPHLIHKDAKSELWMAFFTDPEANTMAIMSEIPTPQGG